MDEFQKLSHRLLGRPVTRWLHPEKLRFDLQRARIRARPEVYLAQAWMTLLITFTIAMLVAGGVAWAASAGASFPPGLVPGALLAPFALVLIGHLTAWYTPRFVASTRARNIDMRLPAAINYTSIMAGAGFTPEAIFESLAKQKVYGEIAREAAWIARDMQMLGKDVVTALSAAIDRSPSRKFQDFLQGAITTLTSGGELKNYFRAKSDQYVSENRQEQRKFLDSLSVLAESYVTVVVAAPVFLVVLLSVMLMFGGNGRSILSTGYMMILVLIPLAQVAFAATLKLIMPER